jgi:hypothetical protein
MSRSSTGPPHDVTPQQRFTAALDALVADVRLDRSVLAAILCGSLSHDVVWARSDIDLVLVTADDRPGDRTAVTLDASGIHVHAFIFPRGQFRRAAEGSLHNSFIHSFVAKGRLLFTHDPTIADLHERLRTIGDRDTRVQLLEAAAGAVACVHKARKWFVTRRDLEYTALWILYAATPIARLEVVGRQLVADREVIPQAAALNPEVFGVIYTELLNAPKTEAGVEAALGTVERYVRDRARQLFAPVFEYLHEAAEARSCTEIEDHFRRHHAIEDVITVCEYLADEGLIGKATIPVRLTKRSTIAVKELAFFATP